MDIDHHHQARWFVPYLRDVLSAPVIYTAMTSLTSRVFDDDAVAALERTVDVALTPERLAKVFKVGQGNRERGAGGPKGGMTDGSTNLDIIGVLEIHYQPCFLASTSVVMLFVPCHHCFRPKHRLWPCISFQPIGHESCYGRTRPQGSAGRHA
jgi:hypothetical protein